MIKLRILGALALSGLVSASGCSMTKAQLPPQTATSLVDLRHALASGKVHIERTSSALRDLSGNPRSNTARQVQLVGKEMAELEAETHITRVGFWTRTMVSSAQIIAFQVVAEDGTVTGPFTLDGASAIHHFETDITTSRLRFEVVESSGGNTGAVEIAVFGGPSR